MRLKSELYKKEQEEIVDKIITILDLENKTEYILYELDKNEEIQKQIIKLIPEIRKYYIQLKKVLWLKRQQKRIQMLINEN
jgi:hypothetical protein